MRQSKNKETPMTFPQKLRFLTAGRSRREIELAAGIEANAIAQYISKEYFPPALKLLSLARVLGVSMEWLCDSTRGIVIPEDATSRAA